MASPQPALRYPRESHIHIASERCPVCDQPIPNEKAEEIRARFEARERALTETVNARAAEQIAAERARIEAAANASVEQIRKESADALKKVTDGFAAREAAARAAGKMEGDAALSRKLAAAERAKADTEAAAQKRIAALEQAATARDSEWQEKLAITEREKQGAVVQYESLKANQDRFVSERVQEVREALEKANANALGAEKAKHFAETQKLRDQLGDVTRRLEKKTADELGEGAEVDLFEELKAEFNNDRIERVGKGVSGADIIHTVIHNSRECGRIIYDSKNSTAWREDYVSKLAQDQTAAKADHAILSTFKFPQGARQVTMRNGVIIVNPARAVDIAQIIRRELVLVHTLRLSKSERAQKMAALFDFITSQPCRNLLDRIESLADAGLKLQEKEMKAHQAHWKQEGLLFKSIQKVKAELETEVDAIIGTDDPAE
jgi:hypothetical protein